MAVLLREAIGERLREERTAQRRTLREVSRIARVSLGYLSEVERGRKEASSELLAAICDALELELPRLLDDVATEIRSDAGTRQVATPVPGAAARVAQPATAEARVARQAQQSDELVPAVVGEQFSEFAVAPVLGGRLDSSMRITNKVVVAA
ncbi:XRE family transcriptional regulator [Actinoalloteichus sp. AHMU CJ021]|uniref:Helix-turn-helix domain-containing protein n=1 Tax=Actinoalloteichus caeruleus DSM 43889 TaxID=1120930 RepID=A0ABT1JQC4_ACTCY|nr:helix-turn-helix transcriptional regulator [Actinoalloteichus caeruleus]AUS80225.1 XRE family transcriptional regulator [Actinoalloteichus sp. AHMU CJ021]MCP2334459.1 Helix-turn-helix domain-containing protein [Actinoalloteichus caeruleus DSM 43889]